MVKLSPICGSCNLPAVAGDVGFPTRWYCRKHAPRATGNMAVHIESRERGGQQRPSVLYRPSLAIDGDDLMFQNVDNEWSIGIAREGAGWHYSACRNGVLWASGWVRCNDENTARQVAWSYGLQATVLP